MLLYPAINELNKKTDSRYTLVILTAKRARDLIANKPKLTDCDAERPVTIAAYEISEDLITYKRREEKAPEAFAKEAEAGESEIAEAVEAVEGAPEELAEEAPEEA